MNKADAHRLDRADDIEFADSDAPKSSILKVLARWWWIPFIMTIAGVGGSFAYIKLATPMYVSKAVVKVTSGARQLFGEESVFDSELNLQTQSRIITSRSVMEQAIVKYDLERLSFFKRKTIDGDAGEATVTKKMNRREQLELLSERINASVGKNTDIIDIYCEAENNEDAAAIANAIASSYKDYHSHEERRLTTKLRTILVDQQEARRKEMYTSLDKMTGFRADHSEFTFGSGGGQDIIIQLSTLTNALTQAKLALLDARSAFEAAQLAAYGELVLPVEKLDDAQAEGWKFPEVKYASQVRRVADARRAQGEVIPIEQEDQELSVQMEIARTNFEELSRQVAQNNPRLVRAQEKLLELTQRWESRNSRFAQAYLVLVTEQYKSARRRVSWIEKDHQDARRNVREYHRLAAQYDRLESQYLDSKRMVDMLASSIKEINVTEDIGSISIDILEKADPALEPSKPVKVQVFAIGAIMGMLAGVAMALVIDWQDQRIRSISDINTAMGVSVIGAIPDMAGEVNDASERGRQVVLAPHSSMAEAVRAVRTSLVLGPDGSKTRTILVTSPDRGDGKSTVTANLAISFSQAHRRTLLVDADFRKPTQNKIFDIENCDGFADALSGKIELSQAVRPSGIERLDLLPCGHIPPHPSELLNSGAFVDAVAKLAEQYDCVIFDSPPLGPVTDGLILASLCDRTILVVRANQTTRRAAEHASDALNAIDANFTGVVANAVPNKRGRYGGYGSYGGYGGYGGYGNTPEGT